MRRGDVWQVDFEPARGSDANKSRPAVIVGKYGANATAARLNRGAITVVPVTRNIDKIHPFQVFLSAATSGLEVDSKTQAEQVRTVATQRLVHRLEEVSPAELERIDDALPISRYDGDAGTQPLKTANHIAM